MTDKLKFYIITPIFLLGILIFIAAFFLADEYLFNKDVLLISFVLFLILSCVFLLEKNLYSPLIFFSLLFFGYVFSGIYFSKYENIEYAKFFQLNKLFSTEDIGRAMLVVTLGYVSFLVGYKINFNRKNKGFVFEAEVLGNESNLVKYVLISLFSLSFFYWLYVSYVLAGGPFELLSNIGIYLLLLEGSNISTAPYLVAYASTSVIFLMKLKKNKRIPFYLIAMIVVGFVMNISTARLAGSIVYLLSFLLMFALHYNKRVDYNVFFTLICSLLTLAGFYFYRYYSNLNYLGLDIDGDFFNVIGEHFFGMTNIGDLQSIAFAGQYVKDFGYLYGESFFDLLVLWVGKFSFVKVDEISIGVRLRDSYFFNIETGAPAPGIISEMVMNYGLFGVTLGMSFLGFAVRLFGELMKPRESVINLYIYTHFLLFLLLLAKVDSTHLSALIWAIFPVFILIFLLSKFIGIFQWKV